ncbi:MAG: YHS domain-containing protein [Desulfobacterales bacterium]|nr:YHS domain-containing protein [Desulfobacterales bacterium]
MLLKFIIFVAVAYFGLKALRSWMDPEDEKITSSSKKRPAIDDDMIKDPFCGVYFSKSNAVKTSIDGRNFSFCSEECKQKFIDSLNKKKK